MGAAPALRLWGALQASVPATLVEAVAVAEVPPAYSLQMDLPQATAVLAEAVEGDVLTFLMEEMGTLAQEEGRLNLAEPWGQGALAEAMEVQMELDLQERGLHLVGPSLSKQEVSSL